MWKNDGHFSQLYKEGILIGDDCRRLRTNTLVLVFVNSFQLQHANFDLQSGHMFFGYHKNHYLWKSHDQFFKFMFMLLDPGGYKICKYIGSCPRKKKNRWSIWCNSINFHNWSSTHSSVSCFHQTESLRIGTKRDVIAYKPIVLIVDISFPSLRMQFCGIDKSNQPLLVQIDKFIVQYRASQISEMVPKHPTKTPGRRETSHPSY